MISELKTLAQDASDSKVKVHARIVPNGVTDDNKLLATLLLTPDFDQGAAGAKLAFNVWPAAVHRLFQDQNFKIDCRVRPVAKNPGPGKLAPAPASPLTVQFHARGLANLSAAQVDTLCDMWALSLWSRQLGEAAAAPDWAGLAGHIRLSLQGSLVSSTALGVVKKDTAPSSDLYGKDGQIVQNRENLHDAPQKLNVESVYDIRHADMAIALEAQRANALCQSLKANMDGTPKTEVQALGEPEIAQQPTYKARSVTGNEDLLIQAIAKQDPRGPGESLATYIKRLFEKPPINGSFSKEEQERAKKALFDNEDVVAELRRRKKYGERVRLFDGLAADRDNAKTAYENAKSRLTASDCQTSPAPEWAGSVKPHTAALDAKGFEETTRAARYANWPQYSDDPSRKVKTDTQERRLSDACQTYFTMQSTPTLARAFALAVDVELDPNDATNAALEKLGGNYGHISVDMGGVTSKCPAGWTLFRLRDPETDGFHFWPVSRDEAGAALSDCVADSKAPNRGTVRHYGGLMVMGFGATDKADTNAPRFDITSLDIRTAMEMEIQRRNIVGANQAGETDLESIAADDTATGQVGAAGKDGKSIPPGVNGQSDATALLDEGDRQDVGLTLLDRGLCAQAIAKMAAKDLKSASSEQNGAQVQEDGGIAVVLDAEELITGYRLFIGTPDSDGTSWHPAMARSIEFGTSGPRDALSREIEPILGKLIGKTGSHARIALESAAMNVPGRMLPKGPVEGDPDAAMPAEAVFEQAVSVWDGGPMGVDCAERPGTENTTGDALIFGRTLRVPTKGRYQLPPLRYGRAYRFALAAVFTGGRSVEQSAFPGAPNLGDVRDEMFYPSTAMASEGRACDTGDGQKADVKPFVRALRQSKIGAPQVLMPEGHALRNNAPMPADQSGVMIVRSLDKLKSNPKDARFTSRDRPKIAQRLVLVPAIPLARAAAHMGEPHWRDGGREKVRGVFDHGRFDASKAPTGGLRNVAQRTGDGGFPSVMSSYLKGLEGVQHFEKRTILRHPKRETMGLGDDLDGSIFKSGSSSGSMFYPDPAADKLVLRLKPRGRDTEFLTMSEDKDALGNYSGIPPIDLLRTHRYPDREPVLLTLTRKVGPRGQAIGSLRDLIGVKRQSFDPALRGDITAGSGHRATEIRVTLAAHEWLDVEMWLVPSALRLARDFSIIQAMATDLAQKCEGSIASGVGHMLSGAALVLPTQVVEKLKELLSKQSKSSPSYFGPGGVAAPNLRALMALATVVRDHMITDPIEEISAVSRLQMVHAANRATQAPSIAPALDNSHFTRATPLMEDAAAVRAYRPSNLKPEERKETQEKTCPEDASAPQNEVTEPASGARNITAVAEGSSNLVLTGDIKLDLGQIDAVEVRARIAFPSSSTFDDRERGRSMAHRRAGWWPLRDDPSGADPNPAKEDEKPKGSFRDSSSLFGFRVGQNGTVQFDRADVTLLRAENLPVPTKSKSPNSISLQNLFEEKDLGDIRISDRHLFPDGKARRMFVRVNGLARTAQFMRTADRKLRGNDPWIGSEGLHQVAGDLVRGENLRAAAQTKMSDEITVVLPATIRPAKPDAKAPVPAFSHELPLAADPKTVALVHRRRSVIRIPLGREWYSSGEDEMMGIVLWPPLIKPTDHSDIVQNLITLRQKDSDLTREIDFDETSGATLTNSNLERILCGALGIDTTQKLPPFEDDHLGPGGKFVSRRGADPVRQGDPHRQIFFSPLDFEDLARDPQDPAAAKLIGHVSMPLSDEKSREDGADGADKPAPPMFVSLVAYHPRFDAEREEWYVDVTLSPSTSAETFVRFGLVRFQPHTSPELQCSRPVAQWVQPLPDRVASVSRQRISGDLVISLSGQTFYQKSASDALFDRLNKPAEEGEADHTNAAGAFKFDMPAHCKPELSPKSLFGPAAGPRMRVSIFREAQDANGRPFRETIALPVASNGADDLLLQPVDHDSSVLAPDARLAEPNTSAMRSASVMVGAKIMENGDGQWCLNVPQTVIGDLKGVKVLLEEVEAVEPATPITVARFNGTVPQSQLDPGDTLSAEPEENDPGDEEEHEGLPKVGEHLTGARMRATFDLSGWAK